MQFDPNQPTAKPTPKPVKWLLYVVLTIVVAGVVFGKIDSCNKQAEAERTARGVAELTRHNKELAMTTAYACIKQRLKSPGSADFGPIEVDSIEQRNDSVFVVLNYVDSQNDFGATKRTYFKAWVVVTPTSHRCEEIQTQAY